MGDVSAKVTGEELPDLAQASDVILIGTVRDVSDSDGADGLASHTEVIISVEKYLTGNNHSSPLILQLHDGDEPSQTFESEEEVLLLLESPNNSVLRKYVISGQRVEELDASLSELERKIAVYLEQPEGETLIAQKLTEPVVMDASAAAISDLTGPPMQEYHPGISKPAGIVDDAVQVAIPFLGGGYSLGVEPVSDGSQTSLISLAGGVTYWLNDHRGILLEIRDAVTLGQPQTGYHHLGVRLGYMWQLGPS